METILFDTHRYVKGLRAVGVPEEQAEVHAELLGGLIEGQLATKRDIKEMEVGLRRDMKEMEENLRRDMKEMEVGLRRDMKEMELRLKHDLTLRLGGMLATGIGIVAALVKLL